MRGNLLERIGFALPIIQAPMAGTSAPAMAAAVTNAGGLGSIGVAAVDAQTTRTMIADIRSQTSGPFNVNVFCHKKAVARPDIERDWLTRLEPVFARYDTTPPASIREIYISFLANSAMMDLFLEVKPPVVSFHFGLPSAD